MYGGVSDPEMIPYHPWVARAFVYEPQPIIRWPMLLGYTNRPQKFRTGDLGDPAFSSPFFFSCGRMDMYANRGGSLSSPGVSGFIFERHSQTAIGRWGWVSTPCGSVLRSGVISFAMPGG